MNNTARIAAGMTTLIGGSALLLAPLTASAQTHTAVNDAYVEVKADASARCEHVSGEFVFTSLVFTSETTAVGVGTQTGDFPGTFHADYSNIRQGPGGPIKMDATHAITTSEEDTLVTSDEILLLPQDEPGVVRANSRLYIVGGTGTFAGATGLLHTSGTVNMDTLEGSIGFKGRICYA